MENKKNAIEPEHYGKATYEAIKVIEEWNLDFHLGNVIILQGLVKKMKKYKNWRKLNGIWKEK